MRQPYHRAPPPAGRRFDRISRDRLEDAVRVLVRGDRAAAARFLDFAESTKLCLDHVWAMLDKKDQIHATVLAAPSTGRTAVLFASRAKVPALVPAIGGLVDAAVRGLRTTDVAMAQALVDPGDGSEERLFIAGGFQKLAELDYLERPVPRFGSIAPPPFPDGVSIAPWDPNDRPMLIGLLERTYEHTLDCPGLAGLRRTEDILAGHLASGTPIPEWWHILRIDDRPEGALLFNRGADAQNLELVYLGLTPAARGKGLGRTLLTQGLSLLDGDAARTIVLAVDRANHPATGLYRRAGFRFSVRRNALVRPVVDGEN